MVQTMESRCIFGFFCRHLHFSLLIWQLMPNCPSPMRRGNGIECLCRWPGEQLNTMRNTEEQILKASGEQGVGLHWVGALGTPAGAEWGAIVLPNPPSRSANRIRRQRAPSSQNPRLFLACPVWSEVLRVPLSCFHKPETSPTGRLWDSIWSTSYQYIWRWLLDVMAPQHGLAFIMTQNHAEETHINQSKMVCWSLRFQSGQADTILKLA